MINRGSYKLEVRCANCGEENIIQLPKGKEFLGFEKGLFGLRQLNSNVACPNCGAYKLIAIGV